MDYYGSFVMVMIGGGLDLIKTVILVQLVRLVLLVLLVNRIKQCEFILQ